VKSYHLKDLLRRVIAVALMLACGSTNHVVKSLILLKFHERFISIKSKNLPFTVEKKSKRKCFVQPQKIIGEETRYHP